MADSRSARARRPILIDTDPGIDDALAVLFALRDPRLEVVAATSIFGNGPTARTTANLVRLLELADAGDVPIGLGAHAPLVDPPHPYGAVVHGHDALGDVGEAGHAIPDGVAYAVTTIIEAAQAHPGELTVVALGPLTNLALALAVEPRLEQLVGEVVIMGGAHSVAGNISAMGEANIVHDVHAAERVLAASWPTTMITIDVTTQVVMSADYLDELGTAGPHGHFLREVTRFYEDFHREHHELAGVFAHDPVAMMWTVAPELFSMAEGPVTVATSGPAYGQTLVDRRPPTRWQEAWSARTPVRYSTGVDADGLLELFRRTFDD
ncbi:MAG: nucleoside hydrolase [Acidimicrobiales bacterium]